MRIQLSIILALCAALTAQAADCKDGDCDADSVVMLQAPGTVHNVIHDSPPKDVLKEAQDVLQEAKEHQEAQEPKERLQEAQDVIRDAQERIEAGTAASTSHSFKLSAVFAEFFAMTLFVIIGCGSAMGVAGSPGEAGWVLQVSLSFGLAISALAYAIGSYSGGQINCAVTFALVLAGQCTVLQGLLNFVAQVLGAILGAFILTFMTPEDKDKTGGLGTNAAPEGRKLGALLGEFMMTFLLVFVVLETAVNPASSGNRMVAALAIGFAVFLAHSVLIPIDGCSINPTRSLGPAIVRKICYRSPGSFEDMWIFWAGPLSGAAAAVCVYEILMKM